MTSRACYLGAHMDGWLNYLRQKGLLSVTERKQAILEVLSLGWELRVHVVLGAQSGEEADFPTGWFNNFSEFVLAGQPSRVTVQRLAGIHGLPGVRWRLWDDRNSSHDVGRSRSPQVISGLYPLSGSAPLATYIAIRATTTNWVNAFAGEVPRRLSKPAASPLRPDPSAGWGSGLHTTTPPGTGWGCGV